MKKFLTIKESRANIQKEGQKAMSKFHVYIVFYGNRGRKLQMKTPSLASGRKIANLGNGRQKSPMKTASPPGELESEAEKLQIK